MSTSIGQEKVTVTAIVELGPEDDKKREYLSSVFSAVSVLPMPILFVESREVQPDDIADCQLVIVDAPFVPDWLRNADVPVVALNCDALYDLGMTLATDGEDFGRTNDQTLCINPDLLDDRLLGGLTRKFRVSKRPGRHGWGRAGEESIIAATFARNTYQTAVFGYNQHSQMPTMRAPQRRLAFLVSLDPDLELAPEVDELLQASVAWAIETPHPVELSRGVFARRSRAEPKPEAVLSPARELPLAEYENWIVDRVNKSVSKKLSRFWGGIGIMAMIAIAGAAWKFIDSTIQAKVDRARVEVQDELRDEIEGRFNDSILEKKVERITGGILVKNQSLNNAILDVSKIAATEFVSDKDEMTPILDEHLKDSPVLVAAIKTRLENADLDVMLANAAHKKLTEDANLRDGERHLMFDLYLAMVAKQDQVKLQDEIRMAMDAKNQSENQHHFVVDQEYRKRVFDAFNPGTAQSETSEYVLDLVLSKLQNNQDLGFSETSTYIDFLGKFKIEHAGRMASAIRNEMGSKFSLVVLEALAKLPAQRSAKNADQVLNVLGELLDDSDDAWHAFAMIPPHKVKNGPKIEIGEPARKDTIKKMLASLKLRPRRRPLDWREDEKCISLARFLREQDSEMVLKWLRTMDPNEKVAKDTYQPVLVAYSMCLKDGESYPDDKREQLADLIAKDELALYRGDLTYVLEKLVTGSPKNIKWSGLIEQLPSLYEPDRHIGYAKHEFVGKEVVRALIEHDRAYCGFETTLALLKMNMRTDVESVNKKKFAKIFGPVLISHLDDEKILKAVVEFLKQESLGTQSSSQTTFTSVIGPALSNHLDHTHVVDAVIKIVNPDSAGASNREAQRRTVVELMKAQRNWDDNSRPSTQARTKVVKAILDYFGRDPENSDVDEADAKFAFLIAPMLDGYCSSKNGLGERVPDGDLLSEISPAIRNILEDRENPRLNTVRNDLVFWLPRQFSRLGREKQRTDGTKEAQSTYADAEKVIRELLETEGPSPKLVSALLATLLRQKKFEPFHDEYKKFEEVISNAEYGKSAIYKLVAGGYVEQGDNEKAAAAYVLAIDNLNREREINEWAYLTSYLASVKFRVGDEKEANLLLNEMRAELEQKLIARYQPSVMHNLLGHTYLGLEKKEALDEFKKAGTESVTQKDRDGKMENIGVFWLRSHEYKKAILICGMISERGGPMIEDRVRYRLPWSSLVTAISATRLATKTDDPIEKKDWLIQAKTAWVVWDRGFDNDDQMQMRLYLGDEFDWFQKEGRRLLEDVELPEEVLKSQQRAFSSGDTEKVS